MITQEQIDRFVKHLEDALLVGLCLSGVDCESNRKNAIVTYTTGNKYIHVMVGGGSRFMIVRETGAIHPVKSWMQINKGYQFGTLDTIDQFDWSRYAPSMVIGKCSVRVR